MQARQQRPSGNGGGGVEPSQVHVETSRVAEGTMEFLITYVRSSIRKDRKGYIIGFLAVFLVTFFLAFFQSTISNVKFIFLKTAENEGSEADFFLLPEIVRGDPNPGYFLNVSEMEERSKGVKGIAGMSGRWAMLGLVSNALNPSFNSTITVLAIDSKKEEEINFGRFWKGRPMGKQESYISASMARTLGVKGKAGERVLLSIDPFAAAQAIFSQAGGLIIGNQNFGADFSTSESLGALAEQLLGISLDDNVTASGNQTSEAASAAIDTIISQNPQLAPFTAGLGGAAGIENALATNLDTLLPNGVTVNLRPVFEDILFPILRQSLVIQEEFIILDTVDYPYGKWPRAIGNVIVIETSEVKRLLLRQIDEAFQNLETSGLLPLLGNEQTLRDQVTAIRQVNLEHYMLQVNVLVEDKIGVYTVPNEEMKGTLRRLSDNFIGSLGKNYRVSIATPLLAVVDAFYFLQLFLDNIFLVVMMLLVFLGSMVIYALLLGNVEAKTYEYGMLRALGMWHRVLSKMLSLNALAFALPAVIAGLILASIINIPIVNIFRGQVNLEVSYVLPGWSWGLALILGVIMPYVANVLPVRKALSSRLRDALDLYRTSSGEITVTMRRLVELGLSPEASSLSISLVAMGFVTFYLMPLSFTMGRIDLFLLLMNLILVAMLVGLSMITQALNSWVEWLFLKFYFYINKIVGRKEDLFLFPIIIKNLDAHRRRNKKTSYMLSITAAFLIFAGVMFALQAKLIRYNAAWLLGADLVVQSINFESPLPASSLSAAINKFKGASSEDLVVDYTFMSFPLYDYDFIKSTRLGSLPFVAGGREAMVMGLERNFLDVCYEGFVVEKERVKSPDNPLLEVEPNIVYALYDGAGQIGLGGGKKMEANDTLIATTKYSNQGVAAKGDDPPYIDTLMSYAMTEYSSITTSTGAKLIVKVSEGKKDLDISNIVRPRALMSKMPTAAFSSYSLLANRAPLFVPMPQAQYLLEQARKGRQTLVDSALLNDTLTEPIAKARMLIKMKDGSSLIDRETVTNAILTVFAGGLASSFNFVIIDTKDLIETTEVAITLLDVVLGLIGFICMSLCFLVSYVSFEANITENAREFAVLRAIGISSRQVQKAYILEALSLVLSSFTLGCLIGITIATSLTLQMNLFLEAPFEFSFPVVNFVILFVISILVAVCASYFPSASLIKEQIANVIKSG
jgi:ABC-type antimicrobial peptide transport system permease subunit